MVAEVAEVAATIGGGLARKPEAMDVREALA